MSIGVLFLVSLDRNSSTGLDWSCSPGTTILSKGHLWELEVGSRFAQPVHFFNSHQKKKHHEESEESLVTHSPVAPAPWAWAVFEAPGVRETAGFGRPCHLCSPGHFRDIIGEAKKVPL